MAEFYAVLFILLLVVMLLLNVFGLPGNWGVLGLVALWRVLHPEADWGWGFVGLLLVFCVIGEILEFITQYFGAKRYGGSTKGGWGAVIGAIVLGIMGAPFFFGLGALIGALLGAYLGALIVEMCCDRTFVDARRAALGAFWGKFFGFAAKISLGVVMLVLSAPRIWP